MTAANTTCRRCSECVGEEHHWTENGRVCEPGDPYYICKHCDAACAEVDDDEGFPMPSGILLAQPPICEGCDFYEKDCDCDGDNGPDDGSDPSSEECHVCGATASEACVCGAAYDECIRDDSTECDCPRCVGAEDAFWREQGGEA